MEHNFLSDNNTKAGTIGGTAFIVLLNINGEEILSTAILAAIGATVSFIMSVLLKNLFKILRKK